jgi:hypothetical protein
MKIRFFSSLCLAALLAATAPSFAQSLSALSSPTRDQLKTALGGMGLSIGQKMSIRSTLQTMQQQGQRVRENSSLSDEQKAAQIVQTRKDALAATAKILNADQQQQLSALLLPKQ